jgi:phospholipid transport system substrate-binding protein
MLSKKTISIFIFIIINIVNLNYSYSIEPNVFVQSTVNRASEALNNKYTVEQKIKKLKVIASETVDINGIGLYTLGSYRKSITSDQKKEYDRLFRQYFLKSFSSRLAEYSNPEIEVKTSKIINKNYTMVSSVLIHTDKRPQVKIDWRVYTKDLDNPLIRDLIIEGLSLVRTQKEEFASIIQSNDGDIRALFNSLNKFIKN